MDKPSLRNLIITLVLGVLGFAMSGWAHADPPSRVARLAYISGAISFSPAGENDWVRATVNRPLITGDRLWADAAGRAELQLGSAAIRLGANTSVTLLNLDDRVAQVQLAQGTMDLRLRRLDRGQTFEVDTPNLAYSIRRAGSYRITVDADGSATTVTVRSGQAEVYGEGSAFVINQGQTYRFFGSGLRDYDSFALLPADEFDRWSSERDRRWENSASARYVSRDLIGYEDLDEYGSWRNVQGYGNVWTPNRVAADWAPYRDGHWAWVEPWGWTWVDDAAWGFAPSHYGRWASIGGAWGWVPGPIAARPVYAPALVAFVGGSNFQVSISTGNVGAVAWFPLGPRDVYRPSYTASRDYFTRLNTSSTVINTTKITNVYNNTNVTNIVYVNQQVPGAVVAVPTAAFAQSRPVAKEAVLVSRQTVASIPVTAVAPIAPLRASVLGAASPSAKPPEAVLARPLVAVAPPPPAPIPFAARERALAAKPGKPLDSATRAALKPTAPVAAPAVKVVTAAKPVLLPPKPASSAVSGQAPAGQAPATAKPGEPPITRPGATRTPNAPKPAKAERLALPPASLASSPRITLKPPTVEERATRAPVAGPRPESPRSATPPLVAPAAPPPVNAAKPVEAARVPLPPASVVSPRIVPKPPTVEEHTTRPPVAVPRPESPKPAPPMVTVPTAPPPVNAAKPVKAPKPAQQAREAQQPPQAQPPQSQPIPPVVVRPPVSAPVPPPRAAKAVPVPLPTQQGASPEPRAPRPKADVVRAPDKREVASDAKKANEQRKRSEDEQGRKP